MATASSGPSRAPRPVEAKHQQLVDAVPLPAALLDTRGIIRAINGAWTEAARPGAPVDTSDAPGQDHLHELRDEKGFHQDAGKAIADALEPVLKGPERGRCQYNLGPGEGDWEVSMSRVSIDDEDLILVVHQDLSASQRLADVGRRVGRLMLQHEGAAAIARDRERLLATAEQEFHAPLTPIRLQMHLLMGGSLGELNERQAKALATVDRNVRRWWHLQQRLMAALTSMENALHPPEDADMGALLDEAMHPFQERALKAGVRLRVDREEEPLPVNVDSRAVVQSVMMLLDHAIRETPAGGLVWVRLRTLDDYIELGVQDQDPEMDPHLAAALLDEENLAETSWGSGLLHVQTVVERHAGDVELTCRGPGQGLEVTLRLPRIASTGNVGVAAPEATTQHA